MQIPHSAIGKIKDEAFNKGKLSALDELAKRAGYESPDEFAQAIANLKTLQAQQAQAQQRTQQPQAQPQQVQDPNANPDDVAAAQANAVAQRSAARQDMAVQRNLEKALNERNRYAQSASEYRKQLENARAEVDAVRAEMHLRTVAAATGVQDIDYAITLLTREVEKLTPEQAEQFDERAYFSGLRAKVPYIFGETVQPATTGVGGGGTPRPQSPGAQAQQQAQNGRIDARKMDPKQYQDLLRSRGLVSQP
jgi:hypothetical protein